MYNHQLDTFLMVARTGSFSSAAEKLFISPSAVNQQITSLEEHLKVSLFTRSRQGLTLTRAGEYLRSAAPDLILRAQDMQDRLSALASGGRGEITVAIPHMHNIRLLYDIWGSYLLENHGASIRLISSKSWDVDDVFQTYTSSDLVEYVNINARWMVNRSFLLLDQVPVGLAIPKQNPIAACSRVPLEMLKGQTIVTAVGAFSSAISHGIQLLENSGAHIQWEESYKNDLMDRCCLENKGILVLYSDYAVHAGYRILPIDWDVTLPYGFSCKQPPSPELESFLRFTEEWKKKYRGE